MQRTIDKERDLVLVDLLMRARECAEWHIEDGDDCGKHARRVIADIDQFLNVDITGDGEVSMEG